SGVLAAPRRTGRLEWGVVLPRGLAQRQLRYRVRARLLGAEGLVAQGADEVTHVAHPFVVQELAQPRDRIVHGGGACEIGRANCYRGGAGEQELERVLRVADAAHAD